MIATQLMNMTMSFVESAIAQVYLTHAAEKYKNSQLRQ